MSTLKLWRISCFDEGPHWDAAIIRAESADAAKAVLAEKIGTGEDGLPATVWSPEPQEDWCVSEIPDEQPVVFLLGTGCR